MNFPNIEEAVQTAIAQLGVEYVKWHDFGFCLERQINDTSETFILFLGLDGQWILEKWHIETEGSNSNIFALQPDPTAAIFLALGFGFQSLAPEERENAVINAVINVVVKELV